MAVKLPSVNNLYWHRNNMKIMKTAAKDLRKQIIEARQGSLLPEIELKARIIIGGTWYCKNGNIKKRDILNLQKFLIDSVFAELQADDKQIFECTWKKVEADHDYFIVEVEKLNREKTNKGLKGDPLD